jgi:hypothetical protein
MTLTIIALNTTFYALFRLSLMLQKALNAKGRGAEYRGAIFKCFTICHIYIIYLCSAMTFCQVAILSTNNL